MHLSTNFHQEIRRKKSPGTNGLRIYEFSWGSTLGLQLHKNSFKIPLYSMYIGILPPNTILGADDDDAIGRQ